jgi:crossover junction endodeoxyribonuclease RuvC
MIVLGVDPGLSGGLALIESGERRRVLFACDIPTMGAKAKARVHVRAVLEILQRHKIDRAVIERAQAMPKQGSSSGFIYGRATGALETCIEGMQIPLEVIESTAWKKHHGLIKPKTVEADVWRKIVKKQSRARAILLYPDSPFWPLEGDHGIAEAALIADYGLSLFTGTSPQSPRSPTKHARKSRQLDLINDALDTIPREA